MLKIFVTGDNHIGLKYLSHEKASLLAASRLEAFSGMVDRANEEECGLFAITGDLFENTHSITKRDIKTLLDILSGFKGTVAILPGNHDYYDGEVKLWQYFKDVASDYDNVVLLSQYRPYELAVNGERVILYPALCTSLHSQPGQNNLGWIKAEQMDDTSCYHVGIAHGAVEGETIENEGTYFLMTRDELEAIPVDLWLIGHTHVPFPRNLTESYSESERIFNAGTHVQTDVNCNTEGGCFIIELDSNKKVRAKRVPTGNLRFYRLQIALTAGRMAHLLSAALSSIDSNSVVDLVLTGAVTAEEYDNRVQIIDAALAPFIEGSYNDYAVSKLISKEFIDKEFAETSFSAALLTALLDEPKEAQLAYELLKKIKEGK